MTNANVLSDIKERPLEYITMLLAFIGSICSSDIDAFWRGLGFFIWIFSNGYMLLGFLRARNIPYSLLFIGYELMNIRGALNAWY